MNRLLTFTLTLLGSVPALAQTPVVLDNDSAAFSTNGTWPTSTAVAGYEGANYQSHAANGIPPAAIVVDNGDIGFATTGTWTASTAVAGYLGANYQHHTANGEPPSAVVADNDVGSALGAWNASTSVTGYYGTNYQTHAAGTGSDSFTWMLNVATSGSYEVYARWTASSNRATNAKYTVTHAGGQSTVTVNQQAGSASWQLLGTYTFDAGAATVSLSDEANGYVIADAVMIVPPGAAPNTASWTLPVASAGTYGVYARWAEHPNRASNARYTVHHANGATEVVVNQQANGGVWYLLGNFPFEAGAAAVSLTDMANGYVIADAVMLLPPGAQPNSATWTFDVAQAGSYQVYAKWSAYPNRASNATYTVTHAGGASAVVVDQQANGGTWNLLGTFSLSPGSGHNVTLTDQANGYVIADAIRLVPVSVQVQRKLYFVEVDHLATPRLVADENQKTVWRWDQQEPFGNNPANEDPDGDGVAFDFPLRFIGTYADRETGMFYNVRRDLDPAIGRYVESDPIGLGGGMNTYLHVFANPLELTDPYGLRASIYCLRCRTGSGGMVCTPFENGAPWPSFTTNMGTNSPSVTRGDPYGVNGPLPPGDYDLPNAYSPKFKRRLPSPTNVGSAGAVRTPLGTNRAGIRMHAGKLSWGCLTTGSGQAGLDIEGFLRQLVARNVSTGGTTLTIEEVTCNECPTCGSQ